MSECPNQSDFCPHCQSEVEISFLEFALRITAKILTCPSCGIVAAVRVPSAKSKGCSLVRSTPNPVRTWRKSTMIETVNARFRHVVVFLYRSVRCSYAAAWAAYLWLYLARRDSSRPADSVAFCRIVLLSNCFGNQAEALSGALATR